MTLKDAIQRIFALIEQLPYIVEEEDSGYRTGRVFINTSMWQRGIVPCPYCGRAALMGIFTIKHDDGRSLSFDPKLAHYVEAGHPITSNDIDGETLIAILADA